MPDGAKASEAASVTTETVSAAVTSAAVEPPPGQYDLLINILNYSLL